ncbi:Chromatin assembly factor 1 subunit A [Cordyceps fumosorosea ARSEF 2679]|uniref:Chromatin assembly factor 1 subunit A n=1 Tax=Cordyceps fumosorosea (strain ARSEF 2679) TaxID=1081104 RepID=A0A162MY89_CORFA|nr:Chromatin assembly factor 1 subunit A [Cordyceps fumosorosea ARSEF 2679]OAA72559.1 Chromatin assembly factor 1 subunit A [Cordyceps fumosorosea ARSEF 2679]
MPLLEMSANVQEPTAARKRSHEEYSGDEGGENISMENKTPPNFSLRPSGISLLPPTSNSLIASTPQGSPALTETGSSTVAGNSPSPETPTKPDAGERATNTAAYSANPAVKRKKLTLAEKDAREKEANEKKEQKEREAAQKKKERDEKSALKAAEKAKQEEEKAARQKERDEKRKKKEEEDKAKAELREEKRKLKEEEERRAQEDRERKSRSQPKLTGFFTKPMTPKKITATLVSNSSPAKGVGNTSNGEPAPKGYRDMFLPFFMTQHTQMAPNACQMDEETREAKSKILDEFIAAERRADVAFDPVSLFGLLGAGKPRGKQHRSVRHIMEAAYKGMEHSGNAASPEVLKAARKKLVGIPVKVIAFARDVRPPYYGTLTRLPLGPGQDNMKRVARRSASRRLQLDYDYDSEAEWQEEEGEDLDAEDDDEEMDDEDDMDGFLDDSEDSGLTRRTFGSTLEPETTGICFENESQKTCSQAATENKMEMILGMLLTPTSAVFLYLLNLPDIFYQTASIDPFATSYWEPEPKQTPTTGKNMPPPPAPANAFAALSGGSADSAPVRLVKPELINDVKKAILENKALSKVGIIDFIYQHFRDRVSRIEVKNTLELVAEKRGTGKLKEWDLKPGHEMTL